MTERRALTLVRATGTILLLLSVVLVIVMPKAPVRGNVPGFSGAVVGFELASTPEHVFGILGRPGDPVRERVVRAMDLTNRIDFLFMLAYPAFFVAIACLLFARGLVPGIVVLAVGALAILMAGSDALENRQLLVLSHVTEPAAMTQLLGRLRACTSVKWTALFGAAILLAPYAWRDPGGLKWSGFAFGLAGVMGTAAVLRLSLLEPAANVLALGWLMAWIHALRARLAV
jgi:hypothetical protein